MRRRRRRIEWDEIRWGTLTRWLKKHEEKIRKKYGRSPFRRDGKISLSVAKRLYADEKFLRELAGSHWKRIRRKLHFYIHILRK